LSPEKESNLQTTFTYDFITIPEDLHAVSTIPLSGYTLL